MTLVSRGGVGRPAGAPDAMDEERLIEQVETDLRREFPGLSAVHVRVVVECVWAEFEGADIRDFVPVLVRKQAREELRDHFHSDADPALRVRAPQGRRRVIRRR